jgi:hypothetical protein
MKEIKEVIIDGEKVSLTKGRTNWKVVYPIKIDGKIVWKNLLAGGSWWNLVGVGIAVFVLIGLMNEYVSNIKLTSACLRALPDYISLIPYLDNPELNNTFLFG